ncbi:MAG: hypothetical protein E6G50_04750 [Actinobacteria bacterium]|nr:MAG: hypothetical protein E6G50_04750 [Actinomycetota bacterium]
MRVAAVSLLAAALFAVPVGTARTPAMFRVIATAPTWSPDGESVAYTQQLPGDRSKLVLASLRDGSRRNLASDGYAPQFSPTGSLVAYIGREPTSGNLDELRIADTALLASAPTFVAGGVANLAWSPDGEELYYDEGWRTCSAIHAFQTYARDRRTVLTGAAPLPSPDGKLLAYFSPLNGDCTGGFGALSVANVDGTDAHVVVDAPAVRAAWSPDGRQLAVEVQNGTDSLIELADASGPGSVLVAHATNPAWSPDGRELAFLTQPAGHVPFPHDEPYLQIVDVRTRDTGPPLLSASAEAQGGPVWSPSGGEVALSRALERGGVSEGIAAGLNRYVSLYAVAADMPAKARRISIAACELLVPRCTLAGGPGGNVLAGGSGNDVVLARDGTRDQVYCGSGYDTVVADRFDAVARDCDHVVRS